MSEEKKCKYCNWSMNVKNPECGHTPINLDVTIEPEWVKELPKLTFYNSLMEVEKEALKRFIEIVINNLK